MEIMINQAITAHQEGRLEEAEQLYHSILENQPTNFFVRNNLGVLQFNLGRFNEAEANYRKVIELKPDYVDAHYGLGIVLNKLSRDDKAEACFKKAIELKPDYAEAHYNLGNAIQILGRFDEAEASYGKAIELKPAYAEAHNNLGATLQILGRYDEAEASYRKAIKLKPDYADAHNNLGTTLKELGRFDEAEASYRMSIILKPNFTAVIKSINESDWEGSRNHLEKICKSKITRMNREVEEFIRLWCIHCKNLISQGDVKKSTKILTKLLIIGERNQYINDLIKKIFENIDINKALDLVDLKNKILIKLSYSQYKFLTENFIQSETLATSNIQEASSLISSPETEDLGWLIIRRSLALYKDKSLAREILNSLNNNLGLTK